jgi:multisubunit Na+/H+ antiporter MnhC subunit
MTSAANALLPLFFMQAVRRGAQGTGVRPAIRRTVTGMLSSAADPQNLLLVAAIVIALVILTVLVALTVREYLLWRRERASGTAKEGQSKIK